MATKHRKNGLKKFSLTLKLLFHSHVPVLSFKLTIFPVYALSTVLPVPSLTELTLPRRSSPSPACCLSLQPFFND